MAERKYQDPGWLRENYRRTSKTMKDLAEEVGLDQPHTVSRWLDRYDIVKLHNDVEWVREKYCEERLNGREIAEIIPYEITPGSVQSTIRENNIERNYQSEEWLREHYCDTDNTMGDLAEMAGVWIGTIYCNLIKNNIETVSVEDRWDVYDNPLKGVTGEDHHMYDPDRVDQDWRHSSEWRQVKRLVRSRDEYTCICGSQENLEVHHIVPVSWDGRKFDPMNLKTLCRSCHRDVTSVLNRTESQMNPEIDWVTAETAVYT